MDANEFFNFDFKDVGRDSFPSLENSSNFERPKESLGLLHPSIIGFLNSVSEDGIDIRRESMPRVDVGFNSRESLGVLSSNFFRSLNISVGLLDDSVFFDDEPSFNRRCLNVPEIFVETSEASKQSVLSPLNTAFLHGQCSATSRKSSALISSSLGSSVSLSSQTSVSGNPSPIYSVSHNSMFNNAFLQKVSSDTEETDSLISKFNRLRIQSLPAILEQIQETELRDVENNCKVEHKSESELKDDFNDLVFIAEAEHITSKIADGSILEISSGEVNLLDSIPHPRWEEILEEEVVVHESPKLQEDVFKLVDKMIPTVKPADNSIINNLQIDSTKSSELQENSACDFNNKTNISHISSAGTSSIGRNEFLQNLSNIFDLQRTSVSQASQSSDKSKSSRDAKDILRNLSDIFKNENRSSEQQAEGQNLIMCLADMLCTEKSKGEEFSEDSGHSSVETDDIQRSNISKVGSGKSGIDKRLSQSFSFLEKKQESPKVDKNLNKCKETAKVIEAKRSRSMSVSSIDKKNLKKLSVGRNSMAGSILSKPSSLGKLKPRRSEELVSSRRGPMKAVIPVGRMSKVKNHGENTKIITPPKAQVLSKRKCTSTPIEESKLYPVAQSTPGSGGNNMKLKSPKSSAQLGQRKFDYSISPLSRSNNSRNTSADKVNNHSGSEPNLPAKVETVSSKINRRRSTNDLKSEERPMGLKRSSSIGQDRASSSQLLKARETANVLKANNTSRIAIHKSRDSLSFKSNLNIKPFNLMSKLKANGKENAGH